ncbi:MAG: hypothetical protein M4D80_15435 [Myxococcota bacterium]|nr:hypothetical protein [Myxococcota bacterium]
MWKVDDRRDVPKAPSKRPYYRASYYVESFHKLVRRGLRLERDRRALGINALDEVPDSTWFTNRRGLTPDDVRRGPLPDTPERHFPWTIKSGKSGGKELGFIAQDARGEKFVLKLDSIRNPEVETAADAIVARLLWAAGWNAASDHVVYFRLADLVAAPDAKIDAAGRERTLDQAYLDEHFGTYPKDNEGRVRGIVSMYIKGVPVGGAPRTGVRGDDPNDRIPHERRRDLRGLAVLFAWLSHADFKEDNTVDAWQEDLSNPQIHYLVHYLIDFGWALGAAASATDDLSIDYRYGLDFAETFYSLATLGIRREIWEDRPRPKLRGVGVFSADDYHPDAWKPTMPSMFAILQADRFDKLWASKILMKLTREQIAAAVDAGRLTDPASARFLVETLIARQRITARHWFRRAAPLDDVNVTADRLCFTDLALLYGLEARATRFTIVAYDAKEHRIAQLMATARADGVTCTDNLPLAAGGDRYTIFRIESSSATPPMLVHVANDPASGTPRVVGIYRL